MAHLSRLLTHVALLFGACVVLTACPDSRREPDAGERQDDGGQVDGGPSDGGEVADGADFDAYAPPAGPTEQLDLVFLIDSSNSMDEEQASLLTELPRLLDILTTGSFEDAGAPGADFEPFTDIQAGVISADMGVGDHEGVPTCSEAEVGDDGLLQTRSGTCEGSFGPILTWDEGGATELESFTDDLSCITGLGTGGCGFEQQLEAVLKGLSPRDVTDWVSPSYRTPRFAYDFLSHGDEANDGLVRRESVLAIVMLTDEEDCSAADLDLFNPSSSTYGSTVFNLRCFRHANPALHSVRRYIEGFSQLRRNPRRLVFFPIVGIPEDLVPDAGETPDWDTLIGEEGVRDDRLIEREDTSITPPNSLVPSCDVPGRGRAFPPIRILQTAHGLQRLNAQVSVQSICNPDLERAMDELAEQIVRAGERPR